MGGGGTGSKTHLMRKTQRPVSSIMLLIDDTLVLNYNTSPYAKLDLL